VPDGTAPLTVVLVRGAFADASRWNGVVERLHASGLRVTAGAGAVRERGRGPAVLDGGAAAVGVHGSGCVAGRAVWPAGQIDVPLGLGEVAPDD
jgi:hypothetical protein